MATKGKSIVSGMWARIRLGGFSSPAKAIEELESEEVHVTYVAYSIIAGKLAITRDGHVDIDLVNVPVRDLGFTELARFDRVCERARELGLEIVPQDTALYVAYQAGDHVDRDEVVKFGMEGVTDSDGVPHVFGLDRRQDGVLLLYARPVAPENQLHPDDWVVFRK